MAYELYYWPDIQGRGEFVRLALEEAGADYVDVARDPSHGGVGAMTAMMERDAHPASFAPPFLKDGAFIIGQTAAILFYLAPKLRLAPEAEDERLWAHQIQLTIADLVEEAHNAHHPISGSLYYEDQKDAALEAATHFRAERIPQFLGWFEAILVNNKAGGGRHLIGRSLTYVDLSLFQAVAGLTYAFPKAVQREIARAPHVASLHDAVSKRPNLRDYFESPRRIAFNAQGIFRNYPELDG